MKYTTARKKCIELCDRLIKVNPAQIVIDLVQDEIEEVAHANEFTPDEIGALIYDCQLLLDIYSDKFPNDIDYINQLVLALKDWEIEATFTNKLLGLDPNQ